jgi:hypothetical protein
MTYLTADPKQGIAFFPTFSLKSRLRTFIMWCSQQDEEHHIGWVGFSIVLMAVIFFPVTMMCILFHGASFPLMIGAMVSLDLVVITNLAALSTRYLIPFLIAGMLIDLIVIIGSFV